MRFFITGATGFIGTELVKRLAASNHEMTCLVRETSNVENLKKAGASLVTGDVTDKQSVLEGMAGADCVVHLANIYSFWEPHKNVYSEVNIEGTRNVMESALQNGVSKVIHVSTVAVFGEPEECPFNEESEPGPVLYSEYARTKSEGDKIAWNLYENAKLPLVVLYPGAVLGGNDPKPSGAIIENIANRRLPFNLFKFFNDSMITWAYVGDVAEAIIRAAENNENVGEKYLIGGTNATLGEFTEQVCDIAGIKTPGMSLPDFLSIPTARLLTLVANITRRPPFRGVSTDAAKTQGKGFNFDSSKVQRELGITLTPMRAALEEKIASID